MCEKSVISFYNCANITDGKIEIYKNKINIKFGHIGIGKTTVIKAIESEISGISKNSELTPYNTTLVPKVVGTSEYKNVIVFNEDYIKQFLFDSNDLLKNSNEIIVTASPNYKETETKINTLLAEMKDSINNNKELSLQITELEKFDNSIKSKQDGTLSGSCQFMKGFKDGNKISNTPTESKVYGNLVSDSKWIVWFKSGKPFQNYLENKFCPYCGSDLQNTSLKRIDATGNNYDKSQIENLSASLSTISGIKSLMSEIDNKEIEKLISTSDSLTNDQQIYMVRLKEDAKILIQKLKTIRDVNYHYFKRIDINILEKELKELCLNPSYYKSFDSDLLRGVSSSVNESINKVIGNIASLKAEVSKHNVLIKKTVEKYEEDINEFLDYAGFKYKVKMNEIDDTYYLVLYPNNSDRGLANVTTHLSYGEKNVFAIALFLYQAVDEKYDLVILDDPISSFDKNKKFAILHKLFKGDISLNNKTVILSTHDFDTIIDLCYVKKGSYNVNAKYLNNKNGILFEQDISKDKIKSFLQIAKENINNSNELIAKLIYARKLLDISRIGNKEENLVWNYISSILHLKTKPDIQNLEDSDSIQMNEEQIDKCEKYLSEQLMIEVNSYDEIISTFSLDYLLKVYNESSSNYLKLQIYRVILKLLDEKKPKEKSRESIFMKFINETYHPENDYIFDLNPLEFERIPNYIIEKCDSHLITTKS